MFEYYVNLASQRLLIPQWSGNAAEVTTVSLRSIEYFPSAFIWSDAMILSIDPVSKGSAQTRPSNTFQALLSGQMP
jgi:hypothetical protein